MRYGMLYETTAIVSYSFRDYIFWSGYSCYYSAILSKSGCTNAAIVMPPQLPIEIAILIFLPYIVAVIAVIIYTNKQIKKIGNIIKKNSEDMEHENESDNHN